MLIIKKNLESILLKSDPIYDNRGWFNVALCMSDIKKLGIVFNGVEQLNHSFTQEAGVIRGLNYQSAPYEQAKLVRCVKGSLYSVGVDIAVGSESFGKWCGFELRANDGYMMYVPRGYAHGFITLEGNTELEYFTDNGYSYENARSIRYDDPAIGIDWSAGGKIKPVTDIMSDKNKTAPYLSDLLTDL